MHEFLAFPPAWGGGASHEVPTGKPQSALRRLEAHVGPDLRRLCRAVQIWCYVKGRL